MRRFFTADTHFGHNGISQMMGRGPCAGVVFSCAEEHDAYLIDRINTKVAPDDELIIVGDFAFERPGRYRTKIRCQNIRFVMGNHDKKQATRNVFGDCPEVIRSRAYDSKGNDHFKLFITHYPSMYWDGSHRGWACLYGHCHAQREDYLDELEPQRRAMDVGMDNAWRLMGDFVPFSECEVYDYMARRSGHDDVRFYEDYQQQLYLQKGLK